MGFRVTSSLTEDWVKIAEMASADPFLNIWHPNTLELECETLDQATLNTAHTAYVADQANIDAATEVTKQDAIREVEKKWYDDKRTWVAVAELLINEINILRQQLNQTTTEANAVAASITVTNFTDRTLAQARTGIRASIDNQP